MVIETTVVQRIGNTILVENSKGFRLSYDVAYDIIYLGISGWYFGKVGGLFGNFNNEPSDDLRNPERKNLSRS